jgi:hypothetical protein
LAAWPDELRPRKCRRIDCAITVRSQESEHKIRARCWPISDRHMRA